MVLAGGFAAASGTGALAAATTTVQAWLSGQSPDHLVWQRECEAAAGRLAAFRNGQIPADELRSLPWAPDDRLHPDAAAALGRLDQAYLAQFGVHLALTSSYRSLDAQLRTADQQGALAATPGTSNHGWGIAVDLGGGVASYDSAEHTWLRANAPAFGWVQPAWAAEDGGLPEPWHWEFHGRPAPGQDAPARPASLQDASGPVEISPEASRAFCD